jgi:uncharacterized protein YndB with AHSA1/START domain
MSDTVTLVYEVYIRTTPEKLWEAITKPQFTRDYYFGSSVESDWREGSALAYRGPEDRVPFEATILAIEPGHKLVHDFKPDPREWDLSPDATPSRVTYEIQQMGPSCLLRVTHEHFHGETNTVESTRYGWQLILSGLKTLLETGKPLVVEEPETVTP